MQILKRDDIYVASHVTGPTHNLLALRLGTGGFNAAFPVVVLPPNGDCRHHEGLTAEEMIPSNGAGVEQANAELGTTYSVEYAEIVENDSRQPAVYQLLA